MSEQRTANPGRAAAERFVPASITNLSRAALIDYCAVMWNRGYAAARRRMKRGSCDCMDHPRSYHASTTRKRK